MKAVVLKKYGSPDDLEIQDVERPSPADDEVLIEVRAASVNDWDWCLVRGSPFFIRLFCGFFKPHIRIPGTDVAGKVVETGENVRGFNAGDEVYGDLSESGFGAFAEYVCAPASALALKPRNLTRMDAAAIPHAAMLALQALRDLAGLQPEHRLLINGGGGGVGTLGVQIAKAMGVEHVTGVDSSDKLKMMRDAGFDRTLDYKQDDFTKGAERYDVILDPKTNRSVFDYLRVLKPGGVYVTVGGSTSRLLQVLVFSSIIRWFSNKRVHILGLKPNKGLDFMNELLEAKLVRPVVEGPYELNQAIEAIRRFGEGKHRGKVMLTLGGGK